MRAHKFPLTSLSAAILFSTGAIPASDREEWIAAGQGANIMIMVISVFSLLMIQAGLLDFAFLNKAPRSTLTYRNPLQSESRIAAAGVNNAASAPGCVITQAKEMTIACRYKPAMNPAARPKDSARIVLNQAQLTFATNHESHMLVELGFTNEGSNSLGFAPTVYLAMDDDMGRNVLRRVLHQVDLSKLHPGEHTTFSERFLVGAFPGGNYTVSLSIPDPEPSRRNTPAYNMLLSNEGVPDATTGLNILARFSVARSMHTSREKQAP